MAARNGALLRRLNESRGKVESMKNEKKSTWRGGWAATCAFAVVSFATVAAQDEAPPTKREIDLMEKVARLEARLNEVEKNHELELRSDALETQVNALSANLGPGDSGALAATWKNGLGFANDDKSIVIRVSCYFQNDWSWASQDDDLENSGIGHLEDGTRFRRARIGLNGELYKYYEFKAEYDFAQGDADFADVYMGVTKISEFLYGIRAGQMKEPISMESLTSARHITFVERGLPNALIPGRNTGLMLYGNAFEERMNWQVGFFRDTDNFGDSSAQTSTAGPGSAARQEDGKYATTVRLSGTPLYETEDSMLLHVGAAFRYANPGNDEFNVSSRPEARIVPNFVASGDFPVDDFITLQGEVAFVWGPFSFQGEIVWTDFSGENSGDAEPNFWGYFVEAAYFLTGESRPYKTRMGTFDRIVPKENFLNDAGGLGAWQLALRYSYLDLTDDGIDGGELSDLTFGINWYMTPNTKWVLDFTYADLDDNGGDGEAYIVTMRFQLDF